MTPVAPVTAFVVRRLLPAGPDLELVRGEPNDDLRTAYRPPVDEWVRVNMVGSLNGSAAGSDGTSDTLSSPVDRLILGIIRSLSDAVVVGAASLRREVFSVPRSAILAVVTATGDLGDREHLHSAAAGKLVVLCPESRRLTVTERLDGVPARVIGLPDTDGRVKAAAVVDSLRALGHQSITVEGGPSLVAQFLGEKQVDEICLSISGQISLPVLPLFGEGVVVDRPLTLQQIYVDETSTLYTRWRL